MNSTEDTPRLRAPVTDPAIVHSLGHTGIGVGEVNPANLHDTQISAVSPAAYAPAHASPYLGTAKRGPNIHDSPDQAEKAIGYAEEIFPDSNFSFLGSGRYGVVLADDTGKAFKVYRSALHYSKYEREAGALQLLSSAGLAPKLHLFVDAGEEYRLDVKAYDYTHRNKGFEKVQIPRQNSGRELPILVMDKVDAAPLESADPSTLADGFCKAAEVFIREVIRSWDSEVRVNNQTGEVIFIDVGELWQAPFDARSATPDTKMKHESEILRDLGIGFGLAGVERQILSVYQEGGLQGVHEFLQQRERPLKM